MVQGIFYLISIIAMIWLAIWYVQQSKLPEGESGYSGLFAMKKPDQLAAEAAEKLAKKRRKPFRDNWPNANVDSDN